MGKQEGESRWTHSKSSTVLLDRAASVVDWKRQIQGKEGIPLQQQRLSFKAANPEDEGGLPERPTESICSGCVEGWAVGDQIQDLQTWKALLQCNSGIVGKLGKFAQVEAESEESVPDLHCQAAQEVRNIGVPSDVFYLVFDKWVPAKWQLGVPQDLANKGSTTPIKLSIEVEKFSICRIDIVGPLEGRGKALVFDCRMNGGESHSQLFIPHPIAQYQQMRHRGSRSQATGNGVAGREAEYADRSGQTHAVCLTPEHRQTHFGKSRWQPSSHVLAKKNEPELFPGEPSETLNGKCVVLKVRPADPRRRLEQLVQPSPVLQHCEGKSDGADAVKKDSGVVLSPSRLTDVSSTEKARHSSRRTHLEQSYTQKSLNHRVFAPHTAEHAADTSLLLPTERQPSPSTSQERVSSPCATSPVETGSVPEAGESDTLQASKESRAGKQSKKKKKKKGRKQSPKVVIQNGETHAHKAALLPVEATGSVHPKSPSADVRTREASPVHSTTSHARLANIDQTYNSRRSANGGKKSRIEAPSDDQNGALMERAPETASCLQNCVEVGEQPPTQSPVSACEWQGVSSGSELEGVEYNWSSRPRGANRHSCELLESLISERTSSLMGCMKSSDNLRGIVEMRNGRSKEEKALYCGLNEAFTYCADSGRLAPLRFLKEVYTTTGVHERGPALLNGTALLDSCQVDPGADRDLISESGKNPGIPSALESLSIRAAQTLQQNETRVEGESARDVKLGVWGGGSRNGRAGGAPSEAYGGKGQGRTSEDRRGVSSNSTIGSSQSSGRYTSQGGGTSAGGGFGSGGGLGNRVSSRGGYSGSREGGWDCRSEGHCENRTNGTKEKCKAVEVEDRSFRYGSADLPSGDHFQRRKIPSSTLDHRPARRVPPADHVQNGSSGIGCAVVHSAVSKENMRWKPKPNVHEDESPMSEASRLRTGDSGEGNLGMEFPYQTLCPSAAIGSVCGAYVNNSSERVHSNGHAVAEGSMSREHAAGSSDQNWTRGDDHRYRSIRRPVYTSDAGSKSGHVQSVREHPMHAVADYAVPNGSYFRQRTKEGPLPHAGNSHAQETVWLKKNPPPINGADDQLPSALKGAPEVPHYAGNGRSAKHLTIPPLNVQFLQQNPSMRESHASDACPVYGTRSAPSTPYSHSGEANFHDTRVSWVSYQDPFLGPASHPRNHVNGVSNSGHFADSRLSQEDASHRGRPGQRAASLQKWVPVDKGATNLQKGLGSKEHRPGAKLQVPTSSSCCDDEKETERVSVTSSTTQPVSAACVREERIDEDDLVCDKIVSRSRDEVSGDADSKVPQQEPRKPLGLMQPAPTEAVVEPKKGAPTSGSQLAVNAQQSHSPRHILGSNDSVLPNGDAHSSSTQGFTSVGSDEKSVGVLPVHHGSTDTVDPSTAARSSPSEELGMAMECECATDAVDAASQQLTFLVTDTIQFSSQGREASELAAMLSGAPLAEFERVLCAVTPALDAVSQEASLGDPSTSCGCSISRGGRNRPQVCSCQLADVPLSAIWQWYEKPSNYGVEVQALDTLRNESGTDTYLAYFVPYLSGMQLYGYKGQRCRAGGWVGRRNHLLPAAVKPRDTDRGAEVSCGASAHLFYEYFEGDPPPQRQPLLQKVQDLLRGDTSSSGQSSGDALCLASTLLGDLHPASWFAVAWYPIYRISDGPLRSVFLTYHSLHHGIPNNTLRRTLGQSGGPSDGRIAFPVVGLECYNTQSERWLSLGASMESASGTKGSQEKPATNPAQSLKQRLHSLQMTAAMMARKLPGRSKHSDYEFFVSRRR